MCNRTLRTWFAGKEEKYLLSKCAERITRRDAVGSFVAITLVKRFIPIGVLSVTLSWSICQFKAFSVEIMYSLTMVLFSVSAVQIEYLLTRK